MELRTIIRKVTITTFGNTTLGNINTKKFYFTLSYDILFTNKSVSFLIPSLSKMNLADQDYLFDCSTSSRNLAVNIILPVNFFHREISWTILSKRKLKKLTSNYVLSFCQFSLVPKSWNTLLHYTCHYDAPTKRDKLVIFFFLLLTVIILPVVFFTTSFSPHCYNAGFILRVDLFTGRRSRTFVIFFRVAFTAASTTAFGMTILIVLNSFKHTTHA